MYRKKPVVIEALRLTSENAKDVCDWIHGGSRAAVPVCPWCLSLNEPFPTGCPVSTGVADNFTSNILICGKPLPCPDHPGLIAGQGATDGE
jgi:hypothetical protein